MFKRRGEDLIDPQLTGARFDQVKIVIRKYLKIFLYFWSDSIYGFILDSLLPVSQCILENSVFKGSVHQLRKIGGYIELHLTYSMM